MTVRVEVDVRPTGCARSARIDHDWVERAPVDKAMNTKFRSDCGAVMAAPRSAAGCADGNC
jgi:hypothetical protein